MDSNKIKTSLVLLATEGDLIRSSLRIDNTDPLNPKYSYESVNKFNSWKHECIRFVSTNFPNDYANDTIKELFRKLEDESQNKSSLLSEIIIILDNLRDCPNETTSNNSSPDEPIVESEKDEKTNWTKWGAIAGIIACIIAILGFLFSEDFLFFIRRLFY